MAPKLIEQFVLTWNPICVFYPDAINLPVFEISITEISLSCPLKNCYVLEIICLTTMVVPSG
jgi:hypothetical protein